MSNVRINSNIGCDMTLFKHVILQFAMAVFYKKHFGVYFRMALPVFQQQIRTFASNVRINAHKQKQKERKMR